MSAIMTINLALAIINGLLALAVGTVYWRNHKQIRSPFTLALLLFALFFVVHNAFLVYHWLSMMMDLTGQGATFLLIEGVLQTAALAALAYATMR